MSNDSNDSTDDVSLDIAHSSARMNAQNFMLTSAIPAIQS